MSNPWAVVGLTYDAEDVQLDDFTLYLTIKTGLDELPTVRGEDVIVPTRAGRIEANRVNDILQIVLVGVVQQDPAETDQDTAKAGWRIMMKFVRTLFAANRERAQLVADLEDGSVAYIDARPMNILIQDRIDGVYASLNIELEGYDDWLIVEPT